jgi:hypothetical protein
MEREIIKEKEVNDKEKEVNDKEKSTTSFTQTSTPRSIK